MTVLAQHGFPNLIGNEKLEISPLMLVPVTKMVREVSIKLIELELVENVFVMFVKVIVSPEVGRMYGDATVKVTPPIDVT